MADFDAGDLPDAAPMLGGICYNAAALFTLTPALLIVRVLGKEHSSTASAKVSNALALVAMPVTAPFITVGLGTDWVAKKAESQAQIKPGVEPIKDEWLHYAKYFDLIETEASSNQSQRSRLADWIEVFGYIGIKIGAQIAGEPGLIVAQRSSSRGHGVTRTLIKTLSVGFVSTLIATPLIGASVSCQHVAKLLRLWHKKN